MFFTRCNTVFMIILIGLGTLTGCNRSGDWIINVSFQLNEREGYPRSDQLVVWLEKPDGTYVKTFFVSEYLSYGGYNEPEICSDWTTKSNWEEASKEEFDAATGATPSIGQVNMAFSVSRDQVPEGEYLLNIEVHLTENYNELYSGKVKFSRRKFSNTLHVSYKPGKYMKATHDVLSHVRVSINK